MCRIPHVLERALEARRRCLELAAVEMRNAPAVMPVPAPAQQGLENLQDLPPPL